MFIIEDDRGHIHGTASTDVAATDLAVNLMQNDPKIQALYVADHRPIATVDRLPNGGIETHRVGQVPLHARA